MVTIDNIAKITKLNDENFQIICKDGQCTILQATFNLCIGINGEIPIIQPLGEYIEENKDTGVFEYIDTTIDKLRALKLKELKSAYIQAQSCKIINGHIFIIPLLGDFFTKDIKGQVDEANLLGVASLVCKDLNEKVIVLKDLPKELWNYFWQQTKPLSTKNYAIKELLEERISDCNTSEELDSIDILAELPPSTLEIIIDLPIEKVVEEETIEISTEETTGTFQDISEETPLNKTTSDVKEVSEEFSMF